MEDEHSRAFGMAHTQILIELLRKLISQQTLTESDARALLESAGNALGRKATDVAHAAMVHVRLIGEEVGVSPKQADDRANK